MTTNDVNIVTEPAPDFECVTTYSKVPEYHEGAALYVRRYELGHGGDTALIRLFYDATLARTIFETAPSGDPARPTHFRVLGVEVDARATLKPPKDGDEWQVFDKPPASKWLVKITLAWSFDNPEGLLPAGAPDAA